MLVNSFHIEIKNGEMVFNSPTHREKWSKFLNQFEGKKVTLKVEDKKPRRTDQQHRYYWVYLTHIAEQTGHDKEDLHELFKGKFLSTGIKDIFGERVRSKVSTKSLSVGRFVEYIMEIEDFTGIEAPDTRDYLGYTFHRPF